MSICLSCRGIGCSACQRTYTLGQITFDPAPPALICPMCMRGLPCAINDRILSDREWKASQPSLSAAIGAVIQRAKSEPDFRSMETQ